LILRNFLELSLAGVLCGVSVESGNQESDCGRTDDSTLSSSGGSCRQTTTRQIFARIQCSERCCEYNTACCV